MLDLRGNLSADVPLIYFRTSRSSAALRLSLVFAAALEASNSSRAIILKFLRGFEGVSQRGLLHQEESRVNDCKREVVNLFRSEEVALGVLRRPTRGVHVCRLIFFRPDAAAFKSLCTCFLDSCSACMKHHLD